MPRIKVITLTPEQQTALEHGYGSGQSAVFRKRCQMILLKSQSRTSQDVARIVGCCEMVVNNWMTRYQQQGIDGVHTKPGRGRKAILNSQTDLEQVRI